MPDRGCRMKNAPHNMTSLNMFLSLTILASFTINHHLTQCFTTRPKTKHYAIHTLSPKINTFPPSSSSPTKLHSITSPDPDTSFWEKIASTLSDSESQTPKTTTFDPITSERDRLKVQLVTLLRVGIPSVLAGTTALALFPTIALTLASLIDDPGSFAVLSQDSSQFVQNFLTVTGLLFSILVGQTYYFMYQQQESIYYALFDEVTEAKSLLEQVALVCQGRSMYQQVLASIDRYVQDDLKQLQSNPADLLSTRPVDDPLESIMYMTSVGVPSSVYETVRSLRRARAGRLGALQRKLPEVHMLLLWILAGIELVSFPLLGAGTQTIGGYNILSVEGCLFGIMTFGIVLTLRVVGELWRPAGGAYNVDAVLSVMVKGMEEELELRMSGDDYAAKEMNPTVEKYINSVPERSEFEERMRWE
eukprot:CAMPEP_0172501154 /NCGR_PEP_ID=MMETSP1066-20121228/146710_1 /TAXON_ID=671091 /ORGANISM="Coscinodiscus wailesii, Strain CCMP2513" /LENGTH=418 /DNA_ID=CAMNT_0013275781 /DNA_START=31 /DNA_END=1287 /DNA_ORIENTATION=+